MKFCPECAENAKCIHTLLEDVAATINLIAQRLCRESDESKALCALYTHINMILDYELPE